MSQDDAHASPHAIQVEKRLTVINSLASALEHVINIVLLVWLQQFLLERIPVEEYAVYVVVVGPLLLIPILVASLSSAVGRFVVVRMSEGDEDAVGRIVSTTAPLAAGIALLFGALMVPLWIWIEPALRVDPQFVDEARTMLVLLVGLTLFRIVTAPFVVGLFVRQRFVLQVWISLGTQVLRLALILALLFSVEVRVLWVVVGTVTAESLGLAVTLIASRRLLPILRFRFSDITWSEAPALAAFGSWTFLKGFSIVSRRAGEPVVLNRMAGALDVTCFHLGALVSTQLQFLMGKVLQPLQPPLAALHARGESKQLLHLYLRVNRLGFLAGLFIALPTAVYRDDLVVLYVGEQFIDAAAVMALLIFQLPARWSSMMTGMLATAMNDQRTPALGVFAINALSLLAIGLALSFGMGAVGAAAAALVATVGVIAVVVNPFGWRLVGITGLYWTKACLLPAAGPTVVGLVGWFALREAVDPQSWLSLFLCFAGGAVLFLGQIWWTAATDEDRTDVRQALQSLARGSR